MAGSSEEGLDNEKLEQYQKQQLALQVRVQRQELSATRAQVQQLQTDRQAAENALSSAASAWAFLEDDVESVAARALSLHSGSAAAADASTSAASSATDRLQTCARKPRKRTAERRDELSACLFNLPKKHRAPAAGSSQEYLKDEHASGGPESNPEGDTSDAAVGANGFSMYNAVVTATADGDTTRQQELHSSGPAVRFLNERSDRIARTLSGVCQRLLDAEARADELDEKIRDSQIDTASALSHSNEQLRQEVASLREELRQAESNRKAAIENEASLSERIDQLQAQANYQAKELQEVTASLEQSKRTIVRLENEGRHPPPQLMPGVADNGSSQEKYDGSDSRLPKGENPSDTRRCETKDGAADDKYQQMENAREEKERQMRVKAEGRIAELEEQLQSRQAELSKQRQIALDKLKECKQLQDGLQDVGLIQKSDMYKQIAQQASDAATERDNLRKERDALQRKLDYETSQKNEYARKAEIAEDYKKTYTEAVERSNELKQRVSTLADERDVAQTALESERNKRRETKTTKELQTAMEQLQSDLKRAKEEAQRHKGAVQELEQARKDASEMREQLQSKEGEIEQLKAQLEERANMDPRKIHKLEREKEELRLFVEVLQGIADLPNQSAASAEAARRAAEQDAAALQEELKKYKDGSEQKKKVEEADRRANAAEREAAAAKEERKRAEEKLAAKEQEAEHLGEEMGNVATAYEESQSQNARLLQQLSSYDEQITEAMNERVGARQDAKRHQEERDRAKQELAEKQKEADAANERASSLERMLKERDDTIASLHEKKSQLQTKLDEANAQMKDNQALQKALQASQEQAEQLSSQRQKEHEQLELERSQQRQLQADLDAAHRKVELVAAGGAEEELNKKKQQERAVSDELDAYKRMFICQVCNKRPRQVCIARCFHLFCKDCVQSSVQSRNRKCPACGQPFSQSDVNEIFF